MGVFNGYGMRITRADGTGKMPWSPTVVNIQRQKARRGKRALIISVVLALVVCFGCSVVWMVMQPGKAKPQPSVAPTTIQLTSTPVATRITPSVKWTPMPGYSGMVQFRVEPIGVVTK